MNDVLTQGLTSEQIYYFLEQMLKKFSKVPIQFKTVVEVIIDMKNDTTTTNPSGERYTSKLLSEGYNQLRSALTNGVSGKEVSTYLEKISLNPSLLNFASRLVAAISQMQQTFNTGSSSKGNSMVKSNPNGFIPTPKDVD